MRVLVIGANGNMGRRYCAIVKYLGHEPVLFDVDSPLFPRLPDRSKYDMAIVASPPQHHIEHCLELAKRCCDFLCEKPISKDPEHVTMLADTLDKLKVDGFMVNNWFHALFVHDALCAKPRSLQYISIDCYNTGNDGAWDYVQPLHLVERVDGLRVEHKSPVLKVHTNTMCDIGRDAFEYSYIPTVSDFLERRRYCWSIRSVISAHERVLEWEEPLGH